MSVSLLLSNLVRLVPVQRWASIPPMPLVYPPRAVTAARLPPPDRSRRRPQQQRAQHPSGFLLPPDSANTALCHLLLRLSAAASRSLERSSVQTPYLPVSGGVCHSPAHAPPRRAMRRLRLLVRRVTDMPRSWSGSTAGRDGRRLQVVLLCLPPSPARFSTQCSSP